MYKHMAFVFCMMIISSVGAQDSLNSRTLDDVVIRQNRLTDYLLTGAAYPVDSAVLALSENGSLTELLRKQGIGHVRSYGPGGLATPNFRGSGSTHTAILWNGMEIQSPASGQLDLSLLPAGIFDDASIIPGGYASLSGNGSIGANIHLDNTVSFNRKLSLGTLSSLGSFGKIFRNLTTSISNEKFSGRINAFYTKSDNDFPFTDNSVLPAKKTRRVHSAFAQYGILAHAAVRINQNNSLTLRYWTQKSAYEVPDIASSQGDAAAEEENVFHRVQLEGNFMIRHWTLLYQGAFFMQDLEYSDNRISLVSDNYSSSIIQKFQFTIQPLLNTELSGGILYTRDNVETENYGNTEQIRHRVAIYNAIKYSLKSDAEFSLAFREELVNGATTPLAITLSGSWSPSEKVRLFGNLSRNYRLPTFNDLYWQGAGAKGNPMLNSEHSVGGEAGVSLSYSSWSLKFTGFSNMVDDWILWNPDVAQVWTPQNLRKVWARGVEIQTALRYNLDPIKIQLKGLYSFTRSTNEKQYAYDNPNELGKQLLLTPVHEMSFTGMAGWKQWWMRVIYTWTGEQYPDSDNSRYNILPHYHLVNLYAGRKVMFNDRWIVDVSAEVNNLFNTAYVARPGYPMPGRNFQLSIRMNYTKQN